MMMGKRGRGGGVGRGQFKKKGEQGSGRNNRASVFLLENPDYYGSSYKQEGFDGVGYDSMGYDGMSHGGMGGYRMQQPYNSTGQMMQSEFDYAAKRRHLQEQLSLRESQLSVASNLLKQQNEIIASFVGSPLNLQGAANLMSDRKLMPPSLMDIPTVPPRSIPRSNYGRNAEFRGSYGYGRGLASYPLEQRNDYGLLQQGYQRPNQRPGNYLGLLQSGRRNETGGAKKKQGNKSENEIDVSDHPLFFCHACSADCTCLQNYDSHMKGSRHKSRMVEVLNLPEKESSGIIQTMKAQEKYRQKKLKERVDYCELCDEDLFSVTLARHKKDGTHKKRELQVRKGCAWCEVHDFVTIKDVLKHRKTKQHIKNEEKFGKEAQKKEDDSVKSFAKHSQSVSHTIGLGKLKELPEVESKAVYARTKVQDHITARELEAESKHTSFCEVCDQHLDVSLSGHIDHKKHKSRSQQVQKGCALCNVESFKSYLELLEHFATRSHIENSLRFKEMNSSKEKKASSENSDDDTQQTAFYCHACHIECHRERNFLTHMNGKRHKKRMNELGILYEEKSTQITGRLKAEKHLRKIEADDNLVGFCKLCDKELKIPFARHKGFQIHKVKEKQVRIGCGWCGVKGFKNFTQVVEHRKTEQHIKNKEIHGKKHDSQSDEENGKDEEDKDEDSEKEEEVEEEDAENSENDEEEDSDDDDDEDGDDEEESEEEAENTAMVTLDSVGFDETRAKVNPEATNEESTPSTADDTGKMYVVPVTGFYCKVCRKFYDEEAAKAKHCQSQQHINKLQKARKRAEALKASKQPATSTPAKTSSSEQLNVEDVWTSLKESNSLKTESESNEDVLEQDEQPSLVDLMK